MSRQKVYGIATVLATLLAAGCMINLPDSVTGNGEVTKEERNPGIYTGIKVSGGIDVYLTQGEPSKVEVEADKNLLEWIKTEVNGSVLHIYTEKNIRMAKSKKVYLTTRLIESIDISSAGDVNGTNPIKGEKLSVDMSSAGDLRIEVHVEELEISISSAGNAYFAGHTGTLRAELSSAGDLNAFDLEAARGDVSVSSAGSARVYITDEARFRSSSAGDIDFRGDPKILEMHTSSAGSVNKK